MFFYRQNNLAYMYMYRYCTVSFITVIESFGLK